MQAIYKTLFALVDAHSGVHTFIGAAGALGLAAWRFSQGDFDGGVLPLTAAFSALGIGLKQHATAGQVAKVVTATAPTEFPVPETRK